QPESRPRIELLRSCRVPRFENRVRRHYRRTRQPRERSSRTSHSSDESYAWFARGNGPCSRSCLPVNSSFRTRPVKGGVTAPQGFLACGIHAGIKKGGTPDLALLVTEREGTIAGMFTKNRVVAAPVVVDRLHLRSGKARAIVVNSGNANACTGAKGLADAK